MQASPQPKLFRPLNLSKKNTSVSSPTVPIVYFYHGAVWGNSLGRQRMLTEQIAKRYPLIFLEIGKGGHQLLGWNRPTIEQVGNQAWVIRGFMDVRRSKLGRKCRRFTGMIDGAWIEDAIAKLFPGPYVFWLSSSMPWIPYGLRRHRLVYDCIDPPFGTNEEKRKQSLETELNLARQAKLCFATAGSLAEDMAASGRPVHLLPNALDPAQLPDDDTVAPESFTPDGRPVVGYLGTIDIRFDTKQVAEAARRCPGHQFVIAGRVNAEHEQDVEELRALENVTVTGSVSFEEGRRLIKCFDIGLIPFKQGMYGDGINPVKMWMYFGLGLPVVGLTTAELRRYPDWVSVADDGIGLAERISQADISEAMAEKRRAFASQNTWAQRAEKGLEILRNAGLLEPSAMTPRRAG